MEFLNSSLLKQNYKMQISYQTNQKSSNKKKEAGKKSPAYKSTELYISQQPSTSGAFKAGKTIDILSTETSEKDLMKKYLRKSNV